MAVDSLADNGLEPAALPKETLAELDALLPPHWSRSNPVDMIGDATVREFQRVTEICLQAAEVDCVLVILVPTAVINPADVDVSLSRQVLQAYGIPVNPTRVAHDRETAVQIAQGMGYPVALKTLPHSMLARFTQIDYDREIALVAMEEKDGREQMLGVARIITLRDMKSGEFAVLVGDPWQGKGIGAILLMRCLNLARERGLETVCGEVLAENTQMLALGRKLGFKTRKIPESTEYEMYIDLKSVEPFVQGGSP